MMQQGSPKSQAQQDAQQPAVPPPPYKSGQVRLPAQDSGSDCKTEADAKWSRCPLHSHSQWDMVSTWSAKAMGTGLAEDMKWEAEMIVYSKDVPRLMKEGFHFTETNVRRRCSYFFIGESYLPESLRGLGWTCARVYHLADTVKHRRTQWTATLMVRASNISLLTTFTLAQLSFDKLDCARAWNKQSQLIYRHVSKHPEESFNAIYEGKPPGEWWGYR